MPLSRTSLAVWFLAGLVALSTTHAAEQRPNLPEGPKVEPRFQVTDRTWPAQPGGAEVCLWKDDKLAAASVTVDDNCAPDVPWWLEVSERYGFPVTWFLITGNVGKSFGGTWELWADVLKKGHDVQSHTHTHLHVEEPGWKDIEWEYTESKRALEENLPGHRVRFLAYPGGKNSGLNDRTVAARHYAAVRGVTGVIPGPQVLDYFGVRCGSGGAIDNPKTPWADPRKVLDPTAKAYRGWCIALYHFMKDAPKENPFFQFLADHRDDLWLARFGDVALYGQERDTATLTTPANTPEGIAFELSDAMDDRQFDAPLTVKVRLYDLWTDVAAEQDGKPVEARIVEHDGSRFALVQAVPDRGTIRIAPKP